MEKKRNLWKHTVKVDGDPEDHQKRRWLMMIEGFPKKNMVTLRVTNHIFWTQGLKSGDNSTLPASTQVRVESSSLSRVISTLQAITRDDNMEEEQDVLSPDTQSFTAAAIKLYSEAKKTFPAKYPHEARFVCTDDWGAKVCLCMQRQQYVLCIHTHTHNRA